MTKSRQFKAGEFTAEEYERLDGLLGSDWSELSNDALVGKIEQAMVAFEKAKETSLAVPSPADNSIPEIMAYIDRVGVELTAILARGARAAHDRDQAAVNADPQDAGGQRQRGRYIGPVMLNSSPGDPAVTKSIAGFLDSVAGQSDAELRATVEKAKTGRLSEDNTSVRKSTRATNPYNVANIAKALDQWGDLDEVQKAAVRAGNPLTWLLDVPNKDEELVKNAASLLGGVRELAKRGAGRTLNLS